MQDCPGSRVSFWVFRDHRVVEPMWRLQQSGSSCALSTHKPHAESYNGGRNANVVN